MSEGMNKVIVAGNLCADPDLRFGQSGADSAVLKLRVAANESYFDKKTNERKERVEYVSVTLFGKRGESLQKILTKGQFVLVEGRLHTSSWEKDGQKQSRTEVVASNVILTGKGGVASSESRPANNERRGFGGSSGQSSNGQRGFARTQGGGDDDYGGSNPGDDDGIPFASQDDTVARWMKR
jgi:single-strand DNA-binding protein